MPFRPTQFGWLMSKGNVEGRAEALKLILGSIYASGGSVVAAAESLGVSRRSMWNWIKELGLMSEVTRARGLRRSPPSPGKRTRATR